MPGGPKDEPTLEYPDHVETVDALGSKARAARARAAGEVATSEAAAPVKIGRYQLLELVGSGGMGMVWGAWDPQLERRVAIKLVRFSSERSQERMLREGQVLAKLSHPNLVPIFDVGEMGDQVYLVMEWIKGVTLRAYLDEKPDAKAVLAAYRQAGEGLAAAHRAGVIHRDFKPDNTIRGDDGRVRVLDFGLAQEAGDTDAPHAGTPRYMAPEQARGEGVSRASDQYSFCISLREALEGAGRVPGWITACIDRGTMANPADRYPEMDELLAQLARDPARRMRRVALGVVVAGAAVGAFAFGRARSADTVEPCSGGDAELVASWGPAVRERVATHLRSLGPAADADRVTKELDDYATTWIGENKRVCLANERHELTPAIHARRVECLGRTRSQLAAVGEVMVTVDAKGLAPALLAASSLPDTRACAEETGSVLPPPAAKAAQVKAIAPLVERALVRATAKQPDAIAEASAAVAKARQSNYQPLIARALLVEARSREGTPAAAELFAEAMRLALRSSDEALAVEAYARWIFARVIADEPAVDHWEVMREIAERTGPPGRFARALMYSNRGLAKLVGGDRVAARALFETALAAAGDSDAIELVSITQNLTQLESEPEVAERQRRAVLDRYTVALGPAHPSTLLAAEQLAMVIPDREQAGAQLATAYAHSERSQRPNPELAWEAAWIADESGDRAAAAKWMERIAGEESAMTKLAAAYRALEAGGDTGPQLAELERFAGAMDLSRVWNRNFAADALVLVARTKPEAWERVLALLEQDPYVTYSRRLARARRMVAERWAASRPADARRLAGLALPWYRRAPGDAAIVARLEQLSAGSR